MIRAVLLGVAFLGAQLPLHAQTSSIHYTLIVELNAQCERGEFPKGELNKRRVADVENAIKAIEAATTQPELRSITKFQ